MRDDKKKSQAIEKDLFESDEDIVFDGEAMAVYWQRLIMHTSFILHQKACRMFLTLPPSDNGSLTWPISLPTGP